MPFLIKVPLVQNSRTLAARTRVKTQDYVQAQTPFQLRHFILARAPTPTQAQHVQPNPTAVIRILATIQEFVPTRSFLRIITHAPAVIRMLEDFAMLELILAVQIHAKMAVCAVIKTVVRGTNATASHPTKVQTATVKPTLVHQILARIQEYA